MDNDEIMQMMVDEMFDALGDLERRKHKLVIEVDFDDDDTLVLQFDGEKDVKIQDLMIAFASYQIMQDSFNDQLTDAEYDEEQRLDHEDEVAAKRASFKVIN